MKSKQLPSLLPVLINSRNVITSKPYYSSKNMAEKYKIDKEAQKQTIHGRRM